MTSRRALPAALLAPALAPALTACGGDELAGVASPSLPPSLLATPETADTVEPTEEPTTETTEPGPSIGSGFSPADTGPAPAPGTTSPWPARPTPT